MSHITVSNIDIEVIRKKIKNVHLSVHPPYGRVRLAVPESMDADAVRIFALSRLPWIKRQQKRFTLQERQTPREFLSGESHYFLGTRYLLNVIETKGKQRAELRNNKQIDLYVRPGSNKDKREQIMSEWYRGELKALIPDYIDKWQGIMGVTVDDWGIKLMKTKWGTCNREAKRIWLNLELAKKHPRCLEYIIVHEMVHLIERNHTDQFKAYMDKYIPNWRSIRDELNDLTFESSRWEY